MPGLIQEDNAVQRERSPTTERNGASSATSTDVNERTLLKALQDGVRNIPIYYKNYSGYACYNENDNTRYRIVIRHPDTETITDKIARDLKIIIEDEAWLSHAINWDNIDISYDTFSPVS